tara:strand:+ start:26317 stop:26739 length:423 start_codon:yes stop_codon:yes gene_type:complete
MAFSQYFATQVLSWVKGAPFPTALSNVYISLHSADPGVSGTNADETAAITNTANRTTIASSALGAVSGASGGGFEITNTGVVQLTTSASNSNAITVTHFGVWDAASGGNFLASGQLTSSVDVELGDTVQFNIGAMAVRVV